MEKVIEWLQGQPDGAEVRWYTDHASKEHPYASSWCDILVPELCDDDGGDNWVWCLGPPWDDDAGGFDIPWEPDLLALRAHGKNEDGNWYDEAVIPIRFRSITETDMTPVRDIVARFPDVTWYGAPAWSTGWMSEGIEAWIEAYAGKRLKAVWDADHGPSRFAEALKAQVDRIKAGEEPTYLLHPGESEGGEGYTVRASGQVMDMLLGLFTGDDGGDDE